MRVKTSRPASTRVVARSSGKQARSKPLEPLDLPEDDNDYRPRGRKKRSKDQTKKQDAEIREAFEKAADDLLDMEGGESAEKKIKSIFKKDFEALKKKLDPENEDVRIEDSSAAFSRTSLGLIYDLMPLAEENYRKTGKEGAAYVISTLINQARDLSNDLRLAEDIEGKVITIKSLIHAMFVRIAELLLREKYGMHRSIDGITSNGSLRKAFRAELDNMILSYAKGLNEFENVLGVQIGAYLSGDPDYLSAGNKSDDGNESQKKKKKIKKRKKKDG